jgi:hypothetical protein
MAEMVVGVTCRDSREPLWVEHISRSTLASHHQALPTLDKGGDALTW